MSRFSPAAKSTEKGAVTPKAVTKTHIQGLRVRPEELPEITHNCWKDWDEILMILKEYFRRHFQDLESICPDPMIITTSPAYVTYPFPTLEASAIAGLNDQTDPMGFQRQTILLVFKSQLSSVAMKKDKQTLEKASAYRVIRSMCSPQLNAILVVLPAFIAVKTDDPLALLAVLKTVVTSRTDGFDVEIDRDQALREWYTLTMTNGEDIIAYGRRAVKTYERIGTSGVPESHFPTPKQQARRFIEGLSSSIPTYNDYKNYLSNSLAVADKDVYPITLVAAINCVTKFHRGAKITTSSTPTNIHHTSLSAAEIPSSTKKRPTKQESRQQKSRDKTPNDSVISDKPSKDKSKITCYNCGKLGHYASDCRSKKKDGASPTHSISAAVNEDESESFYTTFGQLFDKEDDVTRGCMANIITDDRSETVEESSLLTVMSISQSASTEAIFDTGATGTIITNANILSNIQSCTPTNFKGLHGSMRVTKAGKLLDIGIVHYDVRAGLSVISASDILRQGHQWEFKQGSTIDEDAFLVHTADHTYTFRHRRGLYVADLAILPDARHTSGLIARSISAHPAIVKTPNRAMFYTNSLPTTASNAADFTRREVQRSTLARRFQASLGFPPDDKFITALNAGTFLNCDILPADVRRANTIWGPSTAALKGRMTRQRPLPPPQAPLTFRSHTDQHMHCDIMFVNKQAYVVSITQPIGLILVASVEHVAAPNLRQALRRMFGTLGSRHIKVTQFTSDNERGITALFGDMNAMGVSVITVGPGQHAHTIERAIRTLKETMRSAIFSLPYLLPDAMMPHLVLSSAKKLLLFPSPSTRSDKVSPFEAFFGRKADAARDIGPPFGSYCQVSSRVMTNGMEARTIGCLYLEPKMNGTGTHSFMRLDNKAVISANHYTVLPIPDVVTILVNGWASKNKINTSVDPAFTFHDVDITLDAADPDETYVPVTAHSPDTNDSVSAPSQDFAIVIPTMESRGAEGPDPEELALPDDAYNGDADSTGNTVLTGPTEPTEMTQEDDTSQSYVDIGGEDHELQPTHEHPEPALTHVPVLTPVRTPVLTRSRTQPTVQREPSTRVRRAPERYNLATTDDSRTTENHLQTHMSVSRGLRMFKEKTSLAIEGEVKSLLAKKTFNGVDVSAWAVDKKQKILRSIMNIVEKYHPTLDEKGDRSVDKVKARLCVDGRAQERGQYRPDEIESPTASISSIFTIAQIAAAEERFVMIGDVGSAYLNAVMPTDDPAKILYMSIEPDVASEIIRQDTTFAPFQRANGTLVVQLNKALYGCIESAKLWYQEIASTLTKHGFTANPRDICIFNKTVRGTQITIAVYVDDLMMTSTDKKLVLEMEQILLSTYGQFRTSCEKSMSYLGCTWDFSEKYFVKVSQTGMIQDLVASRERTHVERGTKLTGVPLSPGAPYLLDRTPDCPLLNARDAKTFHTDVATALYLANRTKPTITLVISELCKRVKAPTTEDDKKLDRLICYLRATRDVPLRLGCTMPPRVTVSIDAAFANREEMKSTSGMCVTLGVGNFVSSSKVQKLNSKSSTEAEIIAVSDGMNVPLWLADFIVHQGHKAQPVQLEQDNLSCITLLTKGRSTAETTRFIAIRKFWISDYIRNGAINVVYVPTEDMTSDFFTKPVQGAVFVKLSKKILGN